MQQDSFRNWPQGVPVRPSSPTDPSSFSSFVPSPTSTQDAQRKSKLGSASWWFDPLYGREEAAKRGGSQALGLLGEFTTSPFDIGLAGLAVAGRNPQIYVGGKVQQLGRRLIPQAIRQLKGVQATGQAIEDTGRLAGKVLDPAAGTAAAAPTRLFVETGLNVGAGLGAETLGEVAGTPGAIAGAIIGGGVGLGTTYKAAKSIRKGYEKALKLPTIKEQKTYQGISDSRKRNKVAAIKEEPQLKHWIGEDPKNPNKYDVDAYLMDAQLKHFKSKQEAFEQWTTMMKNKVPASVRAIVGKSKKLPGYSRVAQALSDPQNFKEKLAAGLVNPHRIFDPAMYARGIPQQVAHVAEITKFNQKLLTDRIEAYLSSPLKSGNYFYNDNVLGNVELDSTQMIGIKNRTRKANPKYGKIQSGPLTTPENITKINNAYKKAGIKDGQGKIKKITFTEEGGLSITEGELAELYLSVGSKEGAVWRNLDETIMTADIKEHINRLKEVYKFRSEILKKARGRNNKKIDISYIEEGDDSIIPFGAGRVAEDKAIEDAINNTPKFQGMTKQQVKDLLLSRGQFYMGRHVLHRIDPDTGEIMQGVDIGGHMYKIVRGTKKGFEKQREFQWLSEGMEDGWTYLPAHQSAILNINSLMKRVNDLEMARIVESEYKKYFNLNKDKDIAKLYSSKDLEKVEELDVYDADIIKTWDYKKKGKPRTKDILREKELTKAVLEKKQWEATLAKDKELKKAAEDMPVDYDKANQIIVTTMDLLDKIRKNPKTFKRIRSEVEELTKLRRFFPEIDEILGESLIKKTNNDLEKLIKQLRKDVKNEYNLRDYHLKFAVKLQQARRVFGLKSKIDEIPTDRRTRAYKEWVESDDGKYFESIAKEFQNDYSEYVKAQEKVHREIAEAQGKPIPLGKKIKSSDYSKEVKELFESPEEYTLVKQAFDKMAQKGFKNISQKEAELAIKVLDAQMKVRRGVKNINITQEDWRKATTHLNKSVYRKNISSIENHFENYVNLEDIDLPSLTKRLEDNVDDLISKTKAYNDRYKILIKAKRRKQKFFEIDNRSNLFKELYTNAGQADQKARDSLTNSIRRLEDVYTPGPVKKFLEEFNAVQRLAALALDSSLFAIQLAPVLGKHSPVFFKSIGKFAWQTYKNIMNPKQAKEAKDQMYAIPENVVIAQNSKITLSGVSRDGNMNIEFQQALEKGRLLERFSNWVEKAPMGVGYAAEGFRKQVIGRTFGAFGDSFAYTMDYAGFELRKGLDVMAQIDPETALKVDKYVDAIRGMGSSQSSGVLGKQRFHESLFLLAPRYRRAIFSLYGLSMERGPVGETAREGIVNTVAGFMMLTVAFTIAQSGYDGDSEEETREKVRKVLIPTDPNYMLVSIAGQKVGIGGKLIADSKFIAKVIDYNYHGINTDEEREDYENFFNWSAKENPAIKFVRAQLAAGPKEVINAFMGENYIGERHFFKEEGIEQKILTAGRQLSENVIPLWLQSGLYDTDINGPDGIDFTGNGTRLISDFLGLRSWPENAGNLLHRESWDIIGKSYSDLEPYEKKLLTQELREKLNKFQKQQIERTDNEITHYFNNKKEIDVDFYQALRYLLNEHPNTKEGNRNLMYDYRLMKKNRQGRIYQEGLDMEDEWPNRKSDNPILQALNEASSIFEMEGVEIVPGKFDWDMYEDELNKLKARLTPEQVAAIDRNQDDMPFPAEFLSRMQSASKKEYQRIMQSQALREQEFIRRGRADLVELSRRRFFMLDEEGNLDIEDN